MWRVHSHIAITLVLINHCWLGGLLSGQRPNETFSFWVFSQLLCMCLLVTRVISMLLKAYRIPSTAPGTESWHLRQKIDLLKIHNSKDNPILLRLWIHNYSHLKIITSDPPTKFCCIRSIEHSIYRISSRSLASATIFFSLCKLRRLVRLFEEVLINPVSWGLALQCFSFC